MRREAIHCAATFPWKSRPTLTLLPSFDAVAHQIPASSLVSPVTPVKPWSSNRDFACASVKLLAPFCNSEGEVRTTPCLAAVAAAGSVDGAVVWAAAVPTNVAQRKAATIAVRTIVDLRRMASPRGEAW